MEIFLNRNVLLLFILMYTASPLSNSVYRGYFNTGTNISTKNIRSTYDLSERFQLFSPLNANAVYTIRICADIPDNNNGERVHVGRQPGHVFLIVEKLDTITPGQSAVQVFGFYPVQQHSSVISGDVPSKIVDNSNREYNASLSKRVSANQFQLLLEKSEQLAKRKYNLRRFNCYDYVVAVFNSIAGAEKLPVTHIKLPYLLGRAGSPCGLYHDLKKLKDDQSAWAPDIQLGVFTAPQSSGN